MNPSWIFLITFRSFLSLKMDSKSICSVIFPESKVRLNNVWFPELPSSSNGTKTSNLNIGFLPHPVFSVWCQNENFGLVFCLCLVLHQTLGLLGWFLFLLVLFYRKMSANFSCKLTSCLLWIYVYCSFTRWLPAFAMVWGELKKSIVCGFYFGFL